MRCDTVKGITRRRMGCPDILQNLSPPPLSPFLHLPRVRLWPCILYPIQSVPHSLWFSSVSLCVTRIWVVQGSTQWLVGVLDFRLRICITRKQAYEQPCFLNSSCRAQNYRVLWRLHGWCSEPWTGRWQPELERIWMGRMWRVSGHFRNNIKYITRTVRHWIPHNYIWSICSGVR